MHCGAGCSNWTSCAFVTLCKFETLLQGVSQVSHLCTEYPYAKEASRNGYCSNVQPNQVVVCCTDAIIILSSLILSKITKPQVSCVFIPERAEYWCYTYRIKNWWSPPTTNMAHHKLVFTLTKAVKWKSMGMEKWPELEFYEQWC